MSADATAFSITAKGPNQELVTIRGNSWEDLKVNAQHAGIDVASLYRHAFPGDTSEIVSFPLVPPTVEQAEANVIRAFPQAAPVAQPVPQPQAAPAGPSCQHGPRVYKDTIARGESWKRYECAIPWRKGADNSARCKPVNVS